MYLQVANVCIDISFYLHVMHDYPQLIVFILHSKFFIEISIYVFHFDYCYWLIPLSKFVSYSLRNNYSMYF